MVKHIMRHFDATYSKHACTPQFTVPSHHTQHTSHITHNPHITYYTLHTQYTPSSIHASQKPYKTSPSITSQTYTKHPTLTPCLSLSSFGLLCSVRGLHYLLLNRLFGVWVFEDKVHNGLLDSEQIVVLHLVTKLFQTRSQHRRPLTQFTKMSISLTLIFVA